MRSGKTGRAGGEEVALGDKLDYIRQMLLELRLLAEETGEGTLVYMIEMAALEAEECGRMRQRAGRMDR